MPSRLPPRVVAIPRRIRRCAPYMLLALAMPAWGVGERQRLAAPVPAVNASLGHAAATSGAISVLGAPGEGGNTGAAYVYDCSSEPCAASVRLAPPEPESRELFGYAVAVSGNTVAIGAPRADPGAVYVYLRTAGTWNLQAVLDAGGGGGGDRFGIAVSLDGDTLAVGADLANEDQGEAYVFTRSGTAWSGPTPLQADVASPHDAFGSSVAVFGNTVLVGAPFHGTGGTYAHGSVYVYTGAGNNWSQQARLESPDKASGELFGQGVAMLGERALIGGPRAGAGSGKVWVFERDDGAWSNPAAFGAAGALAGDGFGWSVGLSQDRMVVGAPFSGVPTTNRCGRIYQFAYVGGFWNEEGLLLVREPARQGLLGWATATNAARSLVSAPSMGQGANARAGGAYAYDGAISLHDDGYEDTYGDCYPP